jgi:hypothetical protein
MPLDIPLPVYVFLAETIVPVESLLKGLIKSIRDSVELIVTVPPQ